MEARGRCEKLPQHQARPAAGSLLSATPEPTGGQAGLYSIPARTGRREGGREDPI